MLVPIIFSERRNGLPAMTGFTGRRDNNARVRTLWEVREWGLLTRRPMGLQVVRDPIIKTTYQKTR